MILIGGEGSPHRPRACMHKPWGDAFGNFSWRTRTTWGGHLSAVGVASVKPSLPGRQQPSYLGSEFRSGGVKGRRKIRTSASKISWWTFFSSFQTPLFNCFRLTAPHYAEFPRPLFPLFSHNNKTWVVLLVLRFRKCVLKLGVFCEKAERFVDN